MYFIVYKTTNLINGKYYIGCHKTKNLDDGYLGSGKLLKQAIEKYGFSNFTREILFEAQNEQEMFEKEKEFVKTNQEDSNSYNLKTGGNGGFDWINNNSSYSLRNQEKAASARRGAPCSEEHKRKISQANRGRTRVPTRGFQGKTHTTHTKMVMSEKAKVRKVNSQSGTMWVTNGTTSKKIKKDMIIDPGWSPGRKFS